VATSHSVRTTKPAGKQKQSTDEENGNKPKWHYENWKIERLQLWNQN